MNRRSALRALGITGAGLAGAGLVGPVPSLVSPTSPGQGRCFYFATEYEEWDGWSAPGLDLPPGGGMLTVFSATDDDHPSTLSVGSEGNIHGPHVPLTPAIICAIWEGLTSRKLVTLTAAEAATWLDPVPSDAA
jgi:hypothetical protein